MITKLDKTAILKQKKREIDSPSYRYLVKLKLNIITLFIQDKLALKSFHLLRDKAVHRCG